MNRLAIMETSKGRLFRKLPRVEKVQFGLLQHPLLKVESSSNRVGVSKDSDDPIFSDEETALFENSSAFWYSPLAVSMIERVVWGYWVSFAYFRDVSDQLVLVFR